MLELDNKDMPATGAPKSSDSERNISLADTSQSQGGGPDLERSMATPTVGDPMSSALAMSTPVKTCPPHISSVSTCQSAGGSGHERDSTGAPPPAAPWSERESMLKGDIPALPTTAYFGYAASVNGDATLSCPSPPHLATGDFGRPWRCLPSSSALGYYFDDTVLSIPLSSSLPLAPLQPSSYLVSPQDLPRCRLFCWCRDVVRWLRCSGVGPNRKGQVRRTTVRLHS